AGRPFLVLNPATKSTAPEREAQVLRSIQAAQAEIGVPPLAEVSQLWSGVENFACTFPEIDPYRSTRPEPAPGPTETLPQPQPIPAEPFLFGYLFGHDPRVPPLLQSLARAQLPGGIYVRNLT